MCRVYNMLEEAKHVLKDIYIDILCLILSCTLVHTDCTTLQYIYLQYIYIIYVIYIIYIYIIYTVYVDIYYI